MQKVRSQIIFIVRQKLGRETELLRGRFLDIFGWLFKLALLCYHSAAVPDMPLPWYARRLLRKANAQPVHDLPSVNSKLPVRHSLCRSLALGVLLRGVGNGEAGW